MFNKLLIGLILVSGCVFQAIHCEEAPKKIYVSPVKPKSKASTIRDNVQASNSNAYEYIEEVRPIHYSGNGYGYGAEETPVSSYDSYGSHEESYPPSYGQKAIEHRYYTIRKSRSMFSDDVGFVIIIVGLTVFFGALSSILIPLALSLFTSGGLMGLGGGLGGGLFGGGLGAGLPLPGMFGGVLGRRRRSLDATNPTEKLIEYGKQLENALRQYQNKNKPVSEHA